MSAEPIMSAREWFEGMKSAHPPTPDDVTILLDGTRLDSRDAVMAWLAHLEVLRAGQAITDVDG